MHSQSCPTTLGAAAVATTTATTTNVSGSDDSQSSLLSSISSTMHPPTALAGGVSNSASQSQFQSQSQSQACPSLLGGLNGRRISREGAERGISMQSHASIDSLSSYLNYDQQSMPTTTTPAISKRSLARNESFGMNAFQAPLVVAGPAPVASGSTPNRNGSNSRSGSSANSCQHQRASPTLSSASASSSASKSNAAARPGSDSSSDMSSVPSLFREAARQADLVVVVPRAADVRTDSSGRENQQPQPSSQQSSQRRESQEQQQQQQQPASQSQEEQPALTPLLRYHSDSQLSEGQAVGDLYRNTTFSRIHSVATVVGVGDDVTRTTNSLTRDEMRVFGASGSMINGGTVAIPPSPPSPQQAPRQQLEEATSPFKSETREQPTMRPYELLTTVPNRADAEDASATTGQLARFLSDAVPNSGSSAASPAGSSSVSEDGAAAYAARINAAAENEEDEDSSEYSFDDDDDDDEDERANWTAETTLDVDSVDAWRTEVRSGDASRNAGKMMSQEQANCGQGQNTHALNKDNKLCTSFANEATDGAQSQGQGGRSGIRIEPDGKVVKTRRRTRPREAQILMQFFEKEQFPSAEQRDELAMKTGLAPRAVTVWFQNRRQTQKRRATERAAASASRSGASAEAVEKQQQPTPEPVAERREPLDTPSHFRTTLMKMGANFDASPPRNAKSEHDQVGNTGLPAVSEDAATRGPDAPLDTAAAPGAFKDLRSLLDGTHRLSNDGKPALVTSFDCASIDDVMASQACGRGTVAHASFAATDAPVEAIDSAPSQTALPANNKLVDLLARIRQRSTVTNVAPRGEQRAIDALTDAVSVSTLPSDKQSITHASIDEYIHHQRSSSSSVGVPSSPILGLGSQGAKPVNAAIKDLLSLRGGSANQRIKSHSPPAAAPVTSGARSNSEPAQVKESDSYHSDQSRIRLLLLDAHGETARKAKRNATLLQLMQSSSNGSSDEEEAMINDLELPSDEETSLRIIACRRAEKKATMVKKVDGRRQQKAVFSARQAIKQQKEVRKVKGTAMPSARSKHARMHSESQWAFRARRKANLDRVAGRDRASTASSSDEDTDSSAALANKRRKSTKSTLGSRLSGLQRNRTRSAPLALDKKRSHEDALGAEVATVLPDKRRSMLSRSTTGPLHIASLQRGDQRSNTREAPSSPVSSDAEELALFSSGKQLAGSALFRPPTFMLNAGQSRGSSATTSSSTSSAATAHMPRRTSSLAPYNSSYAHQSSGGLHAQQNRAVRVHVNRAGEGQQRSGSHLKRNSYGPYQQTSRMPLGNGLAGNQQPDASSNPLSGGSRSQHSNSNSSSPARSNRSASGSDEEDKENSSPRQVDDSGFFTSTVKAMPAVLNGGSAALRAFAARDSGDVSSSSSPFLTSPTKGRSRIGAEQNDAQKRLGQLAERDRAAAEVLLGLGFSQ